MYMINNIRSILKETSAICLLSSSLIMHSCECIIPHSSMCVYMGYLSVHTECVLFLLLLTVKLLTHKKVVLLIKCCTNIYKKYSAILKKHNSFNSYVVM